MSKRIELLTTLVTSTTVADIGSDHGLLPLRLLENKQVDKVILCDINLHPLLAGYQTIKSNGYLAKATFILGDGLNMELSPKPIDIVIAGMGGMEIISILKSLKQPYNNLILQPNNNVIRLRKYLVDSKLPVTVDDIVVDGKYYNYLVVNKQGKIYNDQEIYLGRGESKEASDYLVNRYHHLQQLSTNHPLSGDNKIEYDLLTNMLGDLWN